ncbi:unnamed protein product [Phyllotreta striolata]|uniref:chitinase n=1 Tax=Phyllotreta striolata TaxID=444603 RepID=A0A9N9TE94_PHYSR|nr:unnamed protein product [Phyllotreta striolata]
MKLVVSVCVKLCLIWLLVEGKSTKNDDLPGRAVPEQYRKRPFFKRAEYGETTLPLRKAVESLPDVTSDSKRLPLRDAVEKRPVPELSRYQNTDGWYNQRKWYSPSSGSGQYSDDTVEILPEEPQYAYYPQYYPFQGTYYTPFQYFRSILNDYKPYRISNIYQSLLASPPSSPAGRNPDAAQIFIGRPELKKTADDDKKIVCYINGVASYRKEPLAFNPEDLDPYLCTHVVYRYATIDPLAYTLTSNDEAYDIIQGGYKAATTLRDQNPQLKVLVAVGGSPTDGSRRFSTMVSNAKKRAEFIRSAIAFIAKYNFDGLEVDWSNPGAEELGGQVTDKEFYQVFLEEISEIFKTYGWVLALSAPASRFKVENGFEPSKLGTIVDFVTIQAYDFHLEKQPLADHHSNLFSRPDDSGLDIFLSVDYAVQFWLRKSFPSSKLVLGVPFFGVSFTLRYSNETDVGAPISGAGREGFYTRTPGTLAYFEICEMILNEGWFRSEDASGSPFIVNGDQWVGYDDEQSLKRKIEYVKEHHLGGVTVKAADFDDFKGLCGVKWPLLTLVNNELKGTTSTFLTDAYMPPTKPIGRCDSFGYFSDSTNCASYYICKNGLLYHLSCGYDLMFNPTNAKCEPVRPEFCRPGETVYIPNALKELQVPTKKENVIEEDSKPKVVCYFTNWAFYRKGDGKFVPEHIDQRLCTHVVYAFASLDAEKLLIKEFDPWADLDNNLYERMTSLKDTKVLLSLGGWTDSTGDKYSRLVSDGSARRRFVIGVVGFLRRHKFSGLHFDWNYPTCWQSSCKRGPSSDKANFAKIIQELRKEFEKQSPPLILAAAISGYKEVIDLAYDLPVLGQNVDFLSVMTYDYHGAWEGQTGHVSPLYSKPGDKYPQYNVNFTMEYLVSKGAPRGKLLVGVPFYGQSYELKSKGGSGENAPANGPGEPGEYTKQPGMLAYYEICYRIRNRRWSVSRNEGRPFAYNADQWVGFEDVTSVKEKASYIRSGRFGGAVAWTIDLDDFNNLCCEGSFPLLKTLSYELGVAGEKPTASDCTKPPPPSTPSPPETTTGVDSGAESDHHHHHHEDTSTVTSTTPWWTTSTSTSKPTAPWWEQSSTTAAWWTTTSTTTKRPSRPENPVVIPPPAVISPEIETPFKRCEPGQYLPDKMNCNAFYRCVDGELKKQYCAGGLHWNRDKHICDWPREANCKTSNDHQKPTPTSKPTNKPTSKPTKKPTTTTTTKPPTTTLQPAISSGTCESGAYYPHELCNHFYVCFNNRLVDQVCAPGLNFHAQSGMCDWSFKVKCTNRRKMGERYTIKRGQYPQPYSKCEGNTFAALPGDCNQYMHCQWGKFEIRQCAPGLHWNNEKNLCDWPQNAHCTEDVDNNELDVDTGPETPPDNWDVPSSTAPPSTTQWKPPSTSSTQWSPPSTTESSGENQWEWHPPIPPTSEKPPLPAPLKPLSGYFKIVCYFTNWAWYRQGLGKYLPEDIDENLCTHIVYGFAVLDYSNYVIKAHDSWADFDNQFYKRVIEYKSKGVKVSIAIGGWNDSLGDKYSKLVNNPEARRRFIEHVVKFLDKYGFDGLDLDWEYPKCWQVDCKKGPDSDKPAFAQFVKELKDAFRPRGYLLSSAVSPSKTVIDAGYDVPIIAENLDWVAVMTYDFHGQWDKATGHVAPLFLHPKDEVAFFNSNYSIHYWISQGLPRRKLIMGMPLYGQSFRLEKASENGLYASAPGPGEAGEFTRAAGFLAFYEICHNIQTKGWTVVQDPLGTMGPYAYKGDQWVSFDDETMIAKKSEYIRRMDLGGGMIWALDLDDFKNRCGRGRHPLLTIIRNTLAEAGDGQQRPIDDLLPNTIEEPDNSLALLQEKQNKHNPVLESLVDPTSQFKVVCYFTNWAWYRPGVGKFVPANIDPDLCTHVVYSFAVLSDDELIIKTHDSFTDFDNKFYEKVTALRAKGVKVLIALGGWNDSAGDKYSRLVNNPSARRRFAAHAADFLEQNRFDGLDLHWEYPKCWQVDCNRGPSTDRAGFAKLVEELSEALAPKGLLLSAAVSSSRKVVDAGYDVPTLSKYLDWIGVMAYDYHGQWDGITGHVAPMHRHPEDVDDEFNMNFTVHYWLGKGADRSKLVLGMPMYAQSFTLSDPAAHGLNAATSGGGEAGVATRSRGFLAYYEVCANVQRKNWTLVRDERGRIGPYAYSGDQWASFDDVNAIRRKSEYVRRMGLGGGMAWALDLDDFRNLCGCEEYPLLRTVNRVLRGYKRADPKCGI